MKTIGITGGIGSGKSLVCHCLEILGFPVFYSDLVAKEIFQSDEVQYQLLKIFNLSKSDLPLRSDFIAKIVFNDVEKLHALNTLIHPIVFSHVDKWKLEKSKCNLVFVESALMLESEMGKRVDFIVGVVAPQALRVKRQERYKARSVAHVNAVIANQLPTSTVIANSDFILNNNEEELLLPQILSLIVKLI